MLKRLPLYMAISLCAGMVSLFAVVHSRQGGFRDRLLDYIDANESTVADEVVLLEEPPGDAEILPPDDGLHPFTYRPGDWTRYAITPEYRINEQGETALVIYSSEDMKVHSYGSMNLELAYGKSAYTSEKYRQFAGDEPVSRVIKSGFEPKQEMQLHMEGRIGKRMTIYIDHDSRKKDNTYIMKYRALGSEEVIQEVNAGEINIKFNQSKYATYDNSTVKGMGVDMTLKKGGLQIKAFGSVMKGESEVEYFRGNSSPGSMRLSEYQYIKRSYYQIEPFIRYNNVLAPPYPANYALQLVNLSPGGFEIWIDDQDPLNNINAVQLPLDGGFYTRMQAGVDYSINFSTGTVRFLREVPANSRIFAVYTLLSGTSTDPYALPPGDPLHPGGIFAGKIFVFLKYGYFITEQAGDDRNKDGKVNKDVYEVRSYYFIGDRNLLSNNFVLQFQDENRLLTAAEIKSMGNYSVDYSEGIIKFIYREPFRELTDSAGTTSRIYTEVQSDKVFEYSRYRVKIDYYREARSFQLGHVNIIPDSVRVKINERLLSQNLYAVDYTAGFLTFNNPNNPLIGPETVIEVRYEYLPLAGQSNAFIGGIRTDYSISDALKLGGSLIYTRSSSSEIIPKAGSAPTQTLVLEGDTSLNLTGKRIADLINVFRTEKIDTVPVDITAYGEYARSYKTVNTFGKLLVDNMEEASDTLYLSMQERDWIMASKPPSVPPLSVRGRLNYYFYRELSSPDSLQGITYPAVKIPYSVKPGPFNVAYGHLPSSIQVPLSMVLDFDGTGEYVSVAARKIAAGPVDLSGIQYVEITYQYIGSSDVALGIDLGSINEDSDADGILETEDVNRNGVLDSDKSRGYTEDVGYDFHDPTYQTRVGSGAMLNQLTIGDGVLNTEDLNGNGLLDTAESVVTVTPLAVTAANSSWRTERIYIDQSALTQSQIDILSRVQTARLYVTKGAAVSGRIYIDGIRFVSTKWGNIRMDGLPAGPDRLKIAVLDTLSDEEYRNESFVMQNRDLYRTLYGKKENSELLTEKESALQLTYSISGGDTVSVTRKFQQPMDLRYYKTMNLWMNFRNFTAGDKVGVVIGSSENDYIEYRIPMDFSRIWRETRLRLTPGSGGEFNPTGITGTPDFKRISFIKLFVQAPGNSGRIWVNDIYMSEPERVEGDAHWVESEIKINTPLFTTLSGTPVFSDMRLKYVYKGHGSQFTTIGRKSDELAEKYHEVFTSMRILPNWLATVDYIRQDTETDGQNELVAEYLRGETRTNAVYFLSDYESDIDGMPSIRLTYKFDDYRNSRNEMVSSSKVNRNTEKNTHAPVINIVEKIENIMGGQLIARVVMNLLFKDYEIDRKSAELSIEDLSSYTALYEREKRQRSEAVLDVHYANSFFYLKPSMNVGTEEIVALAGKRQMNDTQIITDMNGDYHFPFVYNRDLKYVERNKKIGFAAGVQRTKFMAPEYKMEIQYYENAFKDMTADELVDASFSRRRNARSYVSSNITVPIAFSRIEGLKFIRAVNIGYGRIAYLNETSVPYEGESVDPFREKYGIARSLGRLSDAGLNLFRYYPFYFFLGRNNYANGRDYVYRNLNRQIVFNNGAVVSDYNNYLRIIDNFSLNSTMDFSIFTLDFGTVMNQIAERQNVLGLPSQAVTTSVNVNLAFDLMKAFSFSFFRPNRAGLPYHSSTLVIGYEFSDNMLITSNIEELTHTPGFELNFRRDRTVFSLRFGIGFREKKARAFISLNPLNRSASDAIYASNIPSLLFFREEDNSYTFTTLFETDVVWLYGLFSGFYELVAFPIFTFEYTLQLNRYNYLVSLSPEPYDLHLFRVKLTLDLHRNIQGGIFSRLALEQFRNRYTGGVNREIFSYELGLNFSLIF